MLRIGAHMSVAGGVSNAVDRALVHGCEALQIFIKNASQWRGKPLDPAATRFSPTIVQCEGARGDGARVRPKCDGARVRRAEVIAYRERSWLDFVLDSERPSLCILWDVAGARHFRELVCWQLAQELKIELYRFLEGPQVKKDFKYYDQVRDAAASAPRNIAEGFGRRTHAEFARYLDIARGSLAECQNHLQDGFDRGYLDTADFKRLNTLSERTCGAVAGMQRYLRGRRKSAR